jgi:hypothetical protein
MPDPIDWSLTTFEGNRRRQHQEFLALPFSEKLDRIEEMADIAAEFAARHRARMRDNAATDPATDLRRAHADLDDR